MLETLFESISTVNPSAVTATVAVFVGAFTILGVLTARRSYKDKVWQDKVSVARKVFSFGGKHHMRRPSEDRGYPLDPFGDAQTYEYHWMDLGKTPPEGSTNHYETSIPVVVVNNSDEPVVIDSFDVYVEEAKCTIIDYTETLEPKSRIRFALVVQDRFEGTPIFCIEFTDSAGIQWRRINLFAPRERAKLKARFKRWWGWSSRPSMNSTPVKHEHPDPEALTKGEPAPQA